MELNVTRTTDFRSKLGSTEVAAEVLAPLTKKRGSSGEQDSGKSPKKKRGTGSPKKSTADKTGSAAAREAAADPAATNKDSSGGANESWRSTGSSRPLSLVL